MPGCLLELGGSHGLAPEALVGIGEEELLAPDQLERHGAAQRLLQRFDHHPHAARAELAHEPELAQARGQAAGPAQRVEGADAAPAQDLEAPSDRVGQRGVSRARGGDRILALLLRALEALGHEPPQLLGSRVVVVQSPALRPPRAPSRASPAEHASQPIVAAGHPRSPARCRSRPGPFSPRARGERW